MSLHIECVSNPVVTRMTEDEFNEETAGAYKGSGDDEILVLSYDEAVTIEGDLERFARNVWAPVFGDLPDTPAATTQTALATTTVEPTDVTLVYRGADGTTYEQPLADITDAGTLIDPKTGDDLELVSARLIGPPRAAQVELDPFVPTAGEPLITWEVNFDENLSLAEAAKQTWQRFFRRGLAQPGPDEACVFTIRMHDGILKIDLADERFAHLFED